MPNTPSRGRMSIQDRVTGTLRERIETGVYAEGEYLPPERELALELGVSRKTLRRALETLVREGRVRQEHGRGNRVLAHARQAASVPSGLAALVIYDMSRGC